VTGDEVERFDLTRTLDLQAAVLRSQRSVLLHGASDLERSVIATIVSELGSNVLKYARSGTLELRRVRRGLATDIEITARDTGPGIVDVDLALTDHYSSSRSLGLGLPGVRRMADELDIVSGPTGGTTVRARKRLARTVSRVAGQDAASVSRLRADAPRWGAAATVRARSGQRSAGDMVVVIDRGTQVLLAVIDATGHGPGAHALALDLAARLRSGFEASTRRRSGRRARPRACACSTPSARCCAT
jgi:anti-sigma regulatory factor (Ser/Thr protein kinase)